MSDIVERLREKSEWTNQRPYFHAHDKCLEAAAEITRLRAELAEARDKALEEAAEAMENLSFMTDIRELIDMTKQEMSERTCHEAAQAIRALKSPKPPIL